ncbi:MAG: NAD(P)/FAD-dependent oxidoreductase [Hyphomicrobiales bacterium]|nr:NAD(P)/FAD-dependent oxidoreductase [Hyphomicrobiales bacterium]
MVEGHLHTNDAESWLAAFASALASSEVEKAASLFSEECFWRDLVAFTWNVKTLEGRDAIAAMLKAQLAAASPRAWRIDGETTRADGMVEAWVSFETRLARGRGILRLKEGRCWTLLTAIEELKGHEERKGPSRPMGVAHGVYRRDKNWLEAKRAEEETLGKDGQPYCVVIGGGQGGIALGARLRQLGVPTIILEKNARAGDSWRNRYRSLVLHDPVWYDHLPYVPFPENWPVFTPKDKLGDWLEMYAKVMELNYWGSSECVHASYDEQGAEWSVGVLRDGRRTNLTTKQLVFATGAYGPPNVIPLRGVDNFQGRLCHSSGYKTGAPYEGKACIVVGSNSSAHDIAADLWEYGAKVTMLQRSPTTVVRSETLMELGFEPLYSERALNAGITTDNADLIFAATPFRIMHRSQIPVYEEVRRRDASFYARLAKSGFQTDFGEDESGLMMKAFRTGSGYYIDVGCSDLIAKGEIAVRSGVEIRQVKERSVELTDDSELPADLIVMATGFQSMNRAVAPIISEEVADKVGKCWGLGSGVPGDPGPWEGEPRNMWKPTRQPGLWFHGGNLHLSRHYSLVLALQIKARMEGLATPVYGLQPVHHTR